jgi:molybdopterin synthase sulfur carrier subunit
MEMVVTVKFIGALRSASGKSKIAMKMKNSVSIQKLIKEIGQKHPKLENVIIDTELEDSSPKTLILVNGKEISILNGLETMLEDGDDVVFIPVLHGG